MVNQITAIRVQKHNPDRLNIELDGEFAFGLSRLSAAWLKVGEVLDHHQIQTLKESDAHEIAYQKAIRLISYRQRTEKEIRQKLAEKGITNEDIDLVVERLRKAQLIQDQQYAEQWVGNRNELHPRSRRLIRYELRKKGISEHTIDNAIKDSAGDEELAARAADQYIHHLTILEGEQIRKKMTSFLARRGFSYDVIRGVVQDVVKTLMQSQPKNYEVEDDENGKY